MATSTLRPPARVHPRDAATLILWRRRADGTVEILTGLRNAGLRFMPNRLVFPGGRVDFADRAAPAATELRATPRAFLERRAPPRLARALAIAAARELEEETGLHLGGRLPTLDALDYLCRAVTPATNPIRFNARFLIAPADAAQGAINGSGELEQLEFRDLELLQSLPVAPITGKVLGEFHAWLDMSQDEKDNRDLVWFAGRDNRRTEKKQESPGE
ncbi:NUDIX domain-containing protein [Roseomonas sp. 18066]|uniref:NUDIX domain-containing protein n=1 Tax=Roseomonas sp. 18066 TaxID=2681412 RepID=UPI0013594D3A|nr:NUDIX hydrolase [Roseomonas sp. 18066]